MLVRMRVPLRRLCARLEHQRQAEHVAVGLEAVAVDVDEDRIADGTRHVFAVVRSHHRAELLAFADAGHDQVRVALQRQRNRLVEDQRLARETSANASAR